MSVGFKMKCSHGINQENLKWKRKTKNNLIFGMSRCPFKWDLYSEIHSHTQTQTKTHTNKIQHITQSHVYVQTKEQNENHKTRELRIISFGNIVATLILEIVYFFP